MPRHARNPRLVARMAELNLTGKQVADKAGLSYPTISGAICNRVKPQLSTAEKIAKVLKTSVHKLWNDTDIFQR